MCVCVCAEHHGDIVQCAGQEALADAACEADQHHRAAHGMLCCLYVLVSKVVATYKASRGASLQMLTIQKVRASIGAQAAAKTQQQVSDLTARMQTAEKALGISRAHLGMWTMHVRLSIVTSTDASSGSLHLQECSLSASRTCSSALLGCMQM